MQKQREAIEQQCGCSVKVSVAVADLVPRTLDSTSVCFNRSPHTLEDLLPMCCRCLSADQPSYLFLSRSFHKHFLSALCHCSFPKSNHTFLLKHRRHQRRNQEEGSGGELTPRALSVVRVAAWTRKTGAISERHGVNT